MNLKYSILKSVSDHIGFNLMGPGINPGATARYQDHTVLEPTQQRFRM